MGKDLFASWDTAAKWLSGKNIFLFLDFDGTLAPIAPSPGEAALPGSTGALLRDLSFLPNCKLAIVSGRSLADVKAMVGLEGIFYAGNHGLEIEGPGVDLKEVALGSGEALRGFREELKKKCDAMQGVYLEDKGKTLSFHYRQASPDDARRAVEIFEEAVRDHRVRGSIKIVAGKKVFDVRPAVAWDKGNAISWLLGRAVFERGEAAVGPVYIGDDITDEDAFRYLKGKGLTVWVGEGRETSARYRLNDTADVFEFLKRLFSLLTEG